MPADEVVAEHGTDHRLHRLGDELLLRIPRIGWAAEQAALEGRWLPVLAPRLPLALPEQVALGEPTEDSRSRGRCSPASPVGSSGG